MKKYTFLVICCLVLLLSPINIYAQEGFTGPQVGFVGPSASGTDHSGQFYQSATVAQAMTLPNNSLIVLTGNLVNSPRRNYYTFRDATGETVIEIEQKYWGGISVGPNDRVQIYAKMEKKRDGRIEVEAAIIRRI